MHDYSNSTTPLLIHYTPNHFGMIHWGHTGLTLEEHWTYIGGC